MTQIEVLSSPERRRRWSTEQKRSIVAEAFAPGASVCEVARRADVVPNLIYRWRRELRSTAAGFAQVMVAPGADERAVTSAALERRRQKSWRAQSSKCWLHDDPVANRGSGVDRGWPYRHAAWDAELGSPSAGGAQA